MGRRARDCAPYRGRIVRVEEFSLETCGAQGTARPTADGASVSGTDESAQGPWFVQPLRREQERGSAGGGTSDGLALLGDVVEPQRHALAGLGGDLEDGGVVADAMEVGQRLRAIESGGGR